MYDITNMANQFYLTLPSNSQPTNTSAIFETILPINMHLDGEWEVGLAEIIYAYTWNNVSSGQNVIQFLDAASNQLKMLKIPPTRYETIDALVDSIMMALRVSHYIEDFSEVLTIKYNNVKKVCRIEIEPNYVKFVKFSPHLLYMLGFAEEQLQKISYNEDARIILNAQHPPDMTGGLHYLYVYCDLVQPQVVGNILAPLLTVVNVDGDYMKIINRTYISPHYVPVLKNAFSSIEINIKTDLNEAVKFEFGKTIVKLHFRKVS